MIVLCPRNSPERGGIIQSAAYQTARKKFGILSDLQSQGASKEIQ
jgi:hypothetical protein